MNPSIRLLCFDLDDTLWPSAPVLQQAEQTLYRWLQQHAPALCEAHDTQSMREHRVQLLQERPELQHEISRWRLESLTLLLEESGHPQPASVASRAFAVFLEARHRVSYFEGVQEVMARLSRDYMIAGITNGNANVLQLSIGEHFHHALRAEEIKASKPDPRLFEAVLNAAGVSPDQAIHIGDHPINDIAAARNVGMHTIHARLQAEQETADAHAVFEHWQELPDIINSMAGKAW